MAPEVMCHQNHNYSVDYFALGVMAYEFMIGKVPYYFIIIFRGHILVKQGRK
jgi:serine/threonine protein kinase